MSVLGIVVRTHPTKRTEVAARLAALPGCELGPDPGDGRLVIVLESLPDQPAAATMGDIAQWPEVLSISLIYEHSDPDGDGPSALPLDYRSWRRNVSNFAREQAAAIPSQTDPISAAPGAGEPR